MSPRKRKFLGVACACVLALAAGAVPPSLASGPTQGPRRLGAAPRLPLGAKLSGALSGATQMHLSVALNPPDPGALASYAAAVSTPGSSVYHQFLTPAQFADRFGASSAQIGAVEASLRAHGLTPGALSSNHLSIPVTATATQLEQAFSLTLQKVALAGNTTAIVNSAAPLLDSSVAGLVQAVIGLNTLSAPKPLLVRVPDLLHSGAARAHATPHVATGGPQPCSAATAAAPSNSAYTTDQIASAYGFSGLYRAGDEGQGATIALYELEPYATSDIDAYESCYGIDTAVSNVSVDGGAGRGVGSGEAALDIEQVIGLAPKATVLVYEAPNSNSGAPGSGPYDTWNAIVTQDRARVISASWGQCESLEGYTDAAAEKTLFEEAAAQGQTIVSASGDDGSEDCGGTGLAVDDPGSDPYVTGVGGTTLSAIGARPTEQAWNNGGNLLGLLGIEPGAGGGGVSSFWQMPSYQSGAPASLHVHQADSGGAPCGISNADCRESPDVSADADPNTGYLIYWNGQDQVANNPTGWQGIGGTSGAAPLWAAVIGLADASSTCAGDRVGFANPALYKAAADSYADDFNDIRQGNNDFTGTNNGMYPAGVGYDMASGLGTPNATALASSLCTHATAVGPPAISAVSITGVKQDKPQLRFTVSSGTDAPALKRISIRLPDGLRFAGGRRHVVVQGQHGNHARFSSKLSGGVLTVALASGKTRVTVTVSYATIRASKSEARAVRRGDAGKLQLTVTVTDSHGHKTKLTSKVTPAN